MQIGREPTPRRILKPQPVRVVTIDPLADIGAKRQNDQSAPFLCRHLDREKRRIVNDDAYFFHRRDQKIAVVLAFQHAGEQPHQFGTPDRATEIVPSAVGGDADVEVAAKRRIPPLYRWPPGRIDALRRRRQRIERMTAGARLFHLLSLRHGYPWPSAIWHDLGT